MIGSCDLLARAASAVRHRGGEVRPRRLIRRSSSKVPAPRGRAPAPRKGPGRRPVDGCRGRPDTRSDGAGVDLTTGDPSKQGDGPIAGVEFCDDAAERTVLSMKGMILAAGEGTRLRPLTLERPKPMLPVAGRPLLEYTVLWLRSHGIADIAMNLHHRPEGVRGHFGDGSSLGVRITYSFEPTILGTAGGAKKIAGFLDETFVLVYGDVLTDMDLGALVDFHASRGAGPHLTMSLYRVPNPTECGIVALDDRGRVKRFVEKPERHELFSDLASAGVLIVDPAILQLVPDGEFCDFGKDVFPRLLQTDVPMYGWPIPESTYLIDIGSHEKYAQVQWEWPTERARRFLAAAGG